MLNLGKIVTVIGIWFKNCTRDSEYIQFDEPNAYPYNPYNMNQIQGIYC